MLIAYLRHEWIGNFDSQDVLNGILKELHIFLERTLTWILRIEFFPKTGKLLNTYSTEFDCLFVGSYVLLRLSLSDNLRLNSKLRNCKVANIHPLIANNLISNIHPLIANNLISELNLVVASLLCCCSVCFCSGWCSCRHL